MSLKAFQLLGLLGVARVDLMTDENENPYVIDINTMPGMTETSLYPRRPLCRHSVYGPRGADSVGGVFKDAKWKVEAVFQLLELLEFLGLTQ